MFETAVRMLAFTRAAAGPSAVGARAAALRAAALHGSLGHRAAFTLIELLVVIAVVALLVSVLVPVLSAARQRAVGVRCLANLHVFGQGLMIYLHENRDVLPAGRLPNIDSCNAYAVIYGRAKYRPTFLTLMSRSVGMPPFTDPQACNTPDMFKEPGNQQNYASPVYVCPAVPEWTDERNAAYGYNYQFLGNSRLMDENDPQSPYKNWPVHLNWIRNPGRTIAIGDSWGTAASILPGERGGYLNNGRNAVMVGNEGLNLDPPWVDTTPQGEMADPPLHRTAIDARHVGKGNVLFVDGHAVSHTLRELGYRMKADGTIDFTGGNTLWSSSGRDVPWTVQYSPLN